MQKPIVGNQQWIYGEQYTTKHVLNLTGIYEKSQ